ncbi:hypothetical protein GCM10010492_07830 [Saccharothrix mutabilis subsp. mutabilis]|uniref:Uncharacterized protein n=1 Tax=Saccharothrix mutabilis subsp. mutabilis TaxID=66855 RepID=A0ABP3CPS5_9PSEU
MTAGTNRKRVSEVEGADLADESAVTLTAATTGTKPAGDKARDKAKAGKGKRKGGGSGAEGGPYATHSVPVTDPEQQTEPERTEEEPQPVGPEGGPYATH